MPGPSGDSYYRRLDVGRDASHDDIVRAYRRQALAAQPDAHPEDPRAAGRFREITEAYEVLADPGRRAAYDRQALRRRVRVHVQESEGGDARGPRDAGPASSDGEPVLLGRAGPDPGGDVPLRAGPVQVGGAHELDTRAVYLVRDLHDLLDLIVGNWWGRR